MLLDFDLCSFCLVSTFLGFIKFEFGFSIIFLGLDFDFVFVLFIKKTILIFLRNVGLLDGCFNHFGFLSY